MMQQSEYLKEYNNLLSIVAEEFCNKFAAIASPTLSKQETVTFLYQSINKKINQVQKKIGFPWHRVVEFIPRLILMFVRCIYASVRFRVRSLPKNSVYFKTWLVPRCLSGKVLIDDYFRQLPQDLIESEKVIVGFTTLDIGLLNQYSRIYKDKTHIVSFGLLSILDVFKLFLDYLFTALIQTRQKYHLDGIDLTRNINLSLLLDYLELRSFAAYAEKYKCKKLINYKIKAFVYVFENQSWEKICCSILRSNNIRLIGYQSSGFSPVFLNFFPTEQDSRLHPMPDIILTVGDNFSRYLLEHGHYRIPVKPFAALRFSYPFNGSYYTVEPPNLSIIKRILYAFPVQLEQYQAIINELIDIFRNSKIFIELKLHPLYRLNDIKGISKLPANFRVVTDVNMNSLKHTFDCVLFNDNSFGIEALLKGVKSYQYSSDGSCVDNRFMYFDLWKTNYSYNDTKQLRDSINTGSYIKAFDVRAVSEYINAMYLPYSTGSLNAFRKLLNPSVLLY